MNSNNPIIYYGVGETDSTAPTTPFLTITGLQGESQSVPLRGIILLAKKWVNEGKTDMAQELLDVVLAALR